MFIMNRYGDKTIKLPQGLRTWLKDTAQKSNSKIPKGKVLSHEENLLNEYFIEMPICSPMKIS